MSGETRGWRDAAIMLALASLAIAALQIFLNIQLNPLFLIFSLYIPLALALTIYIYLRVRRQPSTPQT